MIQQPDWQNLEVLHTNRLPARTTLVPYSSRSAALTGERAASDRFLLLNGQWDFCLLDNPAGPGGLSGQRAERVGEPARALQLADARLWPSAVHQRALPHPL